MDDPASALQAAENALRLAVRSVLGDAWQGSLDLDSLRQKQEEDRKRREGVVVVDDLLNYVEFYQLTSIILKQWEQFKPVFDDKKRTEVWLATLEDVRNAIAHSRQLVEYERYLVSGISGQIRNLVTLYRTNAIPANAHYAIIESVRDNFGTVGTGDFQLAMQEDYQTHPRLEVGDTLSFTCSGSDGRGRELDWILYAKDHLGLYIALEGQPQPEARLVRGRGNDIVLSWTVGPGDVGENYTIEVYVKPVGSRFTRLGDSSETPSEPWMFSGPPHDDKAAFRYSVNPPLDE